MILLDRTKISGKQLGRIDFRAERSDSVQLSFDYGLRPPLRTELAQIRKYVAALIVVPGAGALEGIELGGSKRRCSNR